MPLYYFVLKTGRHSYPDSEGQEFPDDAAARGHAHAVACELMRNRERRTAHWRIQVCDDYLQPRDELLFADIDTTLEQFDSDLRGTVRKVARTTATLRESIGNIDAGMSNLRQLMNQIDSIASRRPST